MIYLGDTSWDEALFGARDLAGLVIPYGDVMAYLALPRWRWMFDKLEICARQGIEAHPHGILPPAFPVFSKPVFNLYGLSEGARVLRRWTDADYRPGHFWMPLFEGPQWSTDFVLVAGEPVWDCTFHGVQDRRRGGFTRWDLVPARRTRRALAQVRAFLRRELAGFTGIANTETMGGRIIEAHPRMAAQFVDFYGEGWIDRVVALYRTGRWAAPGPATPGSSLVLKADRDGIWRCDRAALRALAREPGVLGLQVALLAPEDRRRRGSNLDTNRRLGCLAVAAGAPGARLLARMRAAFSLPRARARNPSRPPPV